MEETNVEKTLNEVPGFQSTAESVSRGIHNAVLQGGEPTRQLADALHGTWLGHPLHPALTDFVVGALTFGSLFNLISNGDEESGTNKAARLLIKAGIISAIPTALAGLTDYSTIPRRAMTTGAAHGLLNSTGLTLYLLSLRNGGNGSSTGSKLFSTLGFGVMFVSAWLGGRMTYHDRVGVNKAEFPEGPDDWTSVMKEEELAEGEATRVDLDDSPVLLYKEAGEVFAIGAVCPHEGGPLEEGTFANQCVECPWHQSVFDLNDGSVVHGPSTYVVASYDTRVYRKRIQVRLRRTKPAEEEDSRQVVGAIAAEAEEA